MKKFRTFIFGTLILLLGVIRADADCDYAKQAQLNAQVANMDFKYEFTTRSEGMGSIDGEPVEIERTYIKIYVYNLTADLKMTVRDISTKRRTIYTYEDVKDGVITIDSEDVSEVKTYEFNVYPSDTTCGTTELRIHTMNLPKFNEFTRLEMCNETPDFYLCQQFINVEKSFEDFVVERENYLIQLNNQNSTDEDDAKGFVETITSFLNKYKFVILGVVVVGGVVAYVIARKRRSRVI